MARKRKSKHQAADAELRARMDVIYNGALEVIHHTGMQTSNDEPTGGRGRVHRVDSAPDSMLAFGAKHKGLPSITEQIRKFVLKFPNATLAQVRASLPHVNHNTVGSIVSSVKRSMKK